MTLKLLTIEMGKISSPLPRPMGQNPWNPIPTDKPGKITVVTKSSLVFFVSLPLNNPQSTLNYK